MKSVKPNIIPWIRKISFFDTEKMKEVFGIQIKYDGRWVYAGDDNGPYQFDTEVIRNEKLKELKDKGYLLNADEIVNREV